MTRHSWMLPEIRTKQWSFKIALRVASKSSSNWLVEVRRMPEWVHRASPRGIVLLEIIPSFSFNCIVTRAIH